MDGIDIALLETDGEGVEAFGPAGGLTQPASASGCGRLSPRLRL